MGINYRLAAMLVVCVAFLYGAYVTKPLMDQETEDHRLRQERDGEGLMQRLSKIFDPQYQDAYMAEQRRKYRESRGLKDDGVTIDSTIKAHKHQEAMPETSGDAETHSSSPEKATSELAEKKIYRVVHTTVGHEGHNSRVRRSIGVPEVRNFSPFLMLDHFSIAPEAGFPDHPHRGQETITYVLQGALDHEDFTGSRGTLRRGDLQFMTAGRGVVHAEMPHAATPDEQAAAAEAPDDYTPMGGPDDVEGLQLWVDLPVDLKQCEPRYRDLRAAEIPTTSVLGDARGSSSVKVISGEAYGVSSLQDLAYTPVWMLDYVVEPPGNDDAPIVVEQRIPAGFNSFVYIISGANVTIADRTVGSHTNVFFTANPTDPEVVRITVGSSPKTGSGTEDALLAPANSTRFLIVAGQILDQPVVQHGPFVEISRERIIKAFNDYQTFSNGFERAWGWASHIGRRLMV